MTRHGGMALILYLGLLAFGFDFIIHVLLLKAVVAPSSIHTLNRLVSCELEAGQMDLEFERMVDLLIHHLEDTF